MALEFFQRGKEASDPYLMLEKRLGLYCIQTQPYLDQLDAVQI
jgi:hypothetical protein